MDQHECFLQCPAKCRQTTVCRWAPMLITVGWNNLPQYIKLWDFIYIWKGVCMHSIIMLLDPQVIHKINLLFQIYDVTDIWKHSSTCYSTVLPQPAVGPWGQRHSVSPDSVLEHTQKTRRSLLTFNCHQESPWKDWSSLFTGPLFCSVAFYILNWITCHSKRRD